MDSFFNVHIQLMLSLCLCVAFKKNAMILLNVTACVRTSIEEHNPPVSYWNECVEHAAIDSVWCVCVRACVLGAFVCVTVSPSTKANSILFMPCLHAAIQIGANRHTHTREKG